MPLKEYKLSKTLYGHSADVRSLTVTPNSDIISGSRDKTAKFWKYNPLSKNYEECMTYKDQKNFVGSVLYLEPNETFPDGLVITGGNDHAILVYKPSEPFVSFTLKQHNNSVVSLAKGNEVNSFLSGSWDTTAKYWKLCSGKFVCNVTFTGHQAAVWCVTQLKDNRVVTASADKIIGIWNITGDNLMKLTGHTDCVRSLCDFPDLNVFVSVANDAAIKVWNYSGVNINTYYGHTSYIYSIARLNNNAQGNNFVTSDEDRSVRIWENGENTQTITLPAQSIWTVSCLQNGDIVTGSSDGLIRIFTRDESRFADEQALTRFNEEVNAIKQQGMQEIGGVKVSDLPGKEALYDPGKRPGQMKMIREPHGVVAYTWVDDGDNSHWEKIGDVMGGTEKDSNEKTTFEGKSYDFVFSVDVEDGKPPLKLPYNKGDDVYKTAQAFMSKHMLPADYLEQIVDFILKNSNQKFVPQANEYQDPFTGGNRYTPSYNSNATGTGNNLDPFTGGSSYTTVPNKNISNTSEANAFFPVSKYHTFDIGDPKVILNKLKEFNNKVTSVNKNLNENDLEEVTKICKSAPTNANVFDLLFKLLEWPDEYIFPVLDIIRMSVRQETNNEVIVSMNNGIIMNKIKTYLNDSCKYVANTIVSLRTICNLCTHESGETLVYNHCLEILEHISSFKQFNRNTEIAIASVLLNITIVNIKRNDELGFAILSQLLPEMVTKLSDAEAHLRAYVAIGTLLSFTNAKKQEYKAHVNGNQNFLATLQLHSMSSQGEVESKRNKCVQQLRMLL